MIKACIFDLDGTLLDTISTISYYANKTLEEYGFEPYTEDEYKYFAGNGARKLLERMLDAGKIDRDKYFDKMFKFYNKEYDSDVTYGTNPYDGIPELLAELKTLGVTTAVLSNKPDFAAKEAVKRFLGDLIDVTYGGRDGVALKPSTEGVNNLMDELGVSPEECLYIGDTSVDMQTGSSAGIYTIGVLWGFRKRDEIEEAGADMIVAHPSEISKYVKKIFNKK